MIEDQPSVTILIPCYNGAPYLERALDSCLKQTYQNLKILIINDGSTDQSEAIIRSYLSQYQHIHLINQSNQGIAAVRNRLIANAMSDYGFFLDVDDWIEPQCIATFVANAKGSDLVLNSAYVHRQKPQWRPKRFYINGKIDPTTNSKTYLIANAVFVWNCLFKIAYVQNLGLKFKADAPFLEDLVMVLWIYHTNAVVFLNQPHYHYLIHSRSLSHQKFTIDQLENAFKQLEYLYQLIKQTGCNFQCQALNTQLSYYHCLIFSLIQFQSKLNYQQRKSLKIRLQNLEKSNGKLQWPKRYWKWWFYLLYRCFGY